MKGRTFLAAWALVALIAAGCGSSSSSSSSSAAASAGTSSSSGGTANTNCKASVAIEGPFTGPVAQVGLEQLHFAQLAVANDNKSLGIHVTLNQDDTQLTPSIATQKTQAIIASPAVAVIGPSGSQEVEAVGPLLGRAGVAAVTGSATLPALASSGANKTFFRVVPDDNVQGPQDANYIVNHLHPKGVLIVDDDEAYSQGITKVMIPIMEKAGIKVDHETINGTDTGATLSNALSSLVTSHLNPNVQVAVLPWQAAANAQQFGLDAQQQHKKVILFGTDGTNSPSQFHIPGTYISTFGPDIAESNNAETKALASQVTKYGPYGAFGVPTYAATDVIMRAIASVCKSGGTPSRSNVLAAVKTTKIPGSDNILGVPISFTTTGNLTGSPGYLFHVNSQGKYVEIPPK
jgi:branched-chain amino acid transport system substrate-binding protein